MPQSTDPDVRRYDSRDETSTCPDCHAFTLPLRDYEVQESESPTVEADSWELLAWGWWAYVANFFDGSATYKGRKKKLAQLKETVLPGFPRSLVCPRCLHVTPRQ